MADLGTVGTYAGTGVDEELGPDFPTAERDNRAQVRPAYPGPIPGAILFLSGPDGGARG